MKKISLVVICLIFLSGCATVSGTKFTESGRLVSIKDLVKNKSIDYDYRIFNDDLIIKHNNIESRLKIGSSYALIDSRVYNLNGRVIYDKGNILIPERFKSYLRQPEETKTTYYLPANAVIKTVVLDPGHGGKDPGALSPIGLKEKDVNLDIAKRVKSLLVSKGFKVYLTRETDVFITLQKRVEFARRKQADIFISIHSNANASNKLKGLEVYYLANKFTNTDAKVLAAAENLCVQEGISLTSNLKRIIGDMLNSENKKESLMLSDNILDQAKALGLNVRGSYGAPFYVLKYNSLPAVLVEVGYLTNYHEARMLKRDFYRQQIARVISEGVVDLKDKLSKSRVVKK